jgi:hypothetical protein
MALASASVVGTTAVSFLTFAAGSLTKNEGWEHVGLIATSCALCRRPGRGGGAVDHVLGVDLRGTPARRPALTLALESSEPSPSPQRSGVAPVVWISLWLVSPDELTDTKP